MRIYLKNEWANPITLENSKGIYVGRKDNLLSLQKQLMNRKSSILISGVRGVGKTTLVYKAINDLKDFYQKQKTFIIPITINATSLDFHNTTSDNHLVKQIIKSLYANTTNKTSKLEDLYKKCFVEYLKTEENSIQKQDEKVVETKHQIEWEFILAPFLAALGTFFVITNFNLFLKCIGIILISSNCAPLFVSRTIRRNKMNKKELTAQEIYKRDNSTENLLHDLNEYFRENSDKNNYIFIIDELDKLKNENAINVIKTLKNFLSYSNANYIFISDQELYKKIYEANRQKDIESTLFSHYIFLSESTYTELLEYLKQITDTSETIQEDLLKYYNYILYKANLDFFELKKLIDGLHHFSEDGKEYIDCDEFQQTELSIDIERKNNIVQIVYQILERYNYTQPMQQQRNQDNQETIFKFLNEYYNLDYSYDLNKNAVSFPNEKDIPPFNDTNEKHIFALLESLTRFNILEKTIVNASTPNLYNYKWTGQICPNTVIKLNELLPEEQKFVKLYTQYIQLVGDIFDLTNNTKNKTNHIEIKSGEDCSSITAVSSYNDYNTNKDTYMKLTKGRIPEKISIDVLTKSITLLTNNTQKIYDQKLRICSEIVFSRILLDGKKKVSINQQNFGQLLLLSTITQLRSKIISIPNFVIYKNDNSKQIVVTLDFDYNSLSDEIKKQMDEQKHTIYFFNIITKPELNKTLDYHLIETDKKGNEKTVIRLINDNYFIYEFNEDFWTILPIIEKLNKYI